MDILQEAAQIVEQTSAPAEPSRPVQLMSKAGVQELLITEPTPLGLIFQRLGLQPAEGSHVYVENQVVDDLAGHLVQPGQAIAVLGTMRAG